MPLRRSARLLAAGALVLAAPALTSCGFDYATDRVYTPGAGTNDRSADVDVLGSVVVSAEDGSGTLITTFSNNNNDDDISITGIAGAGDDAALTVDGFSTITVPANGLVNLAEAETPIIVSGDFDSGAFLTLEFTFDDGSTVEQEIPTIADCYEYAGLDKSVETGTPAEECAPEPPAAEH